MLGKAAAAAGKAASAAGKAAKAADDKLGVSQAAKAKGDAAKARVMAVPPEQRQQYLETASTVLSVASLLGGRKAGLAASAVGAAASLHTTQVPHAPQTTVVRVVATVPGGQEMTISIETGEMFRVMVPPGVQKGQEFEIEIPMPAGAGGASSSSAPGGGGLLAGASAAMGAAAAGAVSNVAVGVVAKELGVSTGQAKAGMQVAGALGITPTMAAKAALDAKKAGLL